MKHILVYFPYKLQQNPKSGSGVRPKRIVEAFREYGEKHDVEIVVISGESAERKTLTQEYMEKDRAKDALLCYMENSTMPFWLTDGDHIPRNLGVDTRFWNYLKKRGVPIGLFYRDVYWKFDDMYVPPKNLTWLTPVMRWVYRKELETYAKVVDRLYLPSLEMNDYVGWRGTVDELPPGMENVHEKQEIPSQKPKAVFVGGITDQTGIMMMLEAFQSINQDEEVIQLELVCRENEYRRYPEMKKFEPFSWLKVSHKSGDELKEVYQDAWIALIPRERNAYHDFAVPVKLFEYLSYGLPIVATDCKAQARILSENGFGIITKAEVKDFASGVLAAIKPEQYEQMRNNIQTNAFDRHSWYARVEKVVRDLTAK
jgi:glycosyltransferase involved in cell wall biosynthesis